MKKSRVVLLVALFFCFCLFFGCGLFPEKPDPPFTEGNLIVRVSIPAVLTKSKDMQSILEATVLEEIEISLSNEEQSYSKTVKVHEAKDEVEVVFESVSTGAYQIRVVALCQSDYQIAVGNTEATVSAGVNTEASVLLEIEDGHLILDVVLPDDRNIVSGKVTLLGLTMDDIEVLFDAIGGERKQIEIGQLESRIWLIKGDLYNDQQMLVRTGEAQIPVLPGRTTIAEIHFDEKALGGIKLIIHWSLPPEKPKNVSAVFHGEYVTISWDAVHGAVGYMVIRSLTEDGPGRALGCALIETTSVEDYDVDESKTYWYRVISYDAKGFSSNFSDAVSVLTIGEDQIYAFEAYTVEGEYLYASAGGWPVNRNMFKRSKDGRIFEVFGATPPFGDHRRILFAEDTIVIVGYSEVYVSKDNGRTWATALTPIEGGTFEEWSATKDSQGVLYLATYGRPTIPTVYRSADNGASWSAIWTLPTTTHFHEIAVDPYTDDIWITTGDYPQDRDVYKSRNGGNTWEMIIYDRQITALEFDEDAVILGLDMHVESGILLHDRQTKEISTLYAFPGDYSEMPVYEMKKTTSGSYFALQHKVQINHSALWVSRNRVDWELVGEGRNYFGNWESVLKYFVEYDGYLYYQYDRRLNIETLEMEILVQ